MGSSMAKDSGPTGPESGIQSEAPGQPVPIESDDLNEQDLADIRSLLAQKQDITRHDIEAKDFQAMLSRVSKGS